MSLFAGSPEMYALPSGQVTADPAVAAELWAKAFYQAKYALKRIRPMPSMAIEGKPIRDLTETYAECDAALALGED